MSTIEITYFDVDGGRAEPVRLALHLGGIAFNDHRFNFEEFEAIKAKTPLGQVPVLTIDGVQITQCNAMLRYFGKQAGLYPKDDYQALLCDEVLDAVEDTIDKIVATFFLEGDALVEARTKLVAGDLTKYLGFLATKLSDHGGEYFADQQLTIADLKVAVLVGWLNSGSLDHIATDVVKQVDDNLNRHMERVMTTKAIAQYYQNRRNG